MTKDVRWQQRFQNLKKAILFLKTSVEQGTYNKLEAAGLAQSFEFTFELAWKTLKDYLLQEGHIINSPRETIKQAFQNEMIADGHLWMKMLEDRNRFSYTYDEKQAEAATPLIRETYFPAIYQVYELLNQRS